VPIGEPGQEPRTRRARPSAIQAIPEFRIRAPHRVEGFASFRCNHPATTTCTGKEMNMNRTGTKIMRMYGYSTLFGISLAAVFCSGALFAQTGDMGKSMLKEKLAAIKTSSAENQRKLRQYSWTETSQVTVNGDAKPPKQSLCSYGPDGKVQKVPLGSAAQTPSQEQGRRGRLKERIVAMKTAEMKDYMQQVGHVIQLYTPPDPQKMEQAFRKKNVSVDLGNGGGDLVFKDYALPGDSMTIAFDPATKKIKSLNVRTYLDTPQDAVNLVVEFATLPDGTSHPSRTTLDAQGKGIHVVNTNSNYRKAVM
jgi:hypothetical protein